MPHPLVRIFCDNQGIGVPAQGVALHRDTTPLEQAAESFLAGAELAGADLAATSRVNVRSRLQR
jgi:hypothetical protein